MKSGEVIIKTGGIPHTEIFSYTADGLPWVNHEWLAGIIFYILHEAGRFTLLYIFKSLMVIASFALVIWSGVKKPGVCPACAGIAALWMVIISGGRLYFDIRPYLFTYILLAATIWILYKAYGEGRMSALWYIVPVSLLWVNTHGGYILVYILQAAFLFSVIADGFIFRGKLSGAGKSLLLILTGLAMLTQKAPVYYIFLLLFVSAGIAAFINRNEETEKTDLKKLLSGAVPPFLASLAAGILNPYGAEIFLYPFTFLGDSFYKRNLIEWIPPDLTGANLGFGVSMGLIIVLTAVFSKKLRTYDVAVIAVFSYLSLTVVRHSVLFAIAMVPVVSVLVTPLLAHFAEKSAKSENGVQAENSETQEKSGEDGHGGDMRRQSKATVLKTAALYGSAVCIAAVFFILFVIPGQYRINYRKLNMERQLFPVAGVEFVKNNQLPGRLYNPYEWGGYLIWRLYPDYKVFMDGRANTVYTEEQYRESLSTMRGDPGWDKILDKYNVNFVFCNKILRETNQHLLPDRLGESGKWALIFEDDIEQIFMRKTPENEKIIQAAEQGRLYVPITPYKLSNAAAQCIAKQDLSQAGEFFRKSLVIDPDYIPALAGLGYIKIQTGNRGEAEIIFRRILEIDPSYPSINFNLGKLYEIDGNPTKAAEYYQKELKVNPGFEPARRSLDQILKGNRL